MTVASRENVVTHDEARIFFLLGGGLVEPGIAMPTWGLHAAPLLRAVAVAPLAAAQWSYMPP